eukprot:jgi/Psemu1/314538/fgenesh1_kg.1584_\
MAVVDAAYRYSMCVGCEPNQKIGLYLMGPIRTAATLCLNGRVRIVGERPVPLRSEQPVLAVLPLLAVKAVAAVVASVPEKGAPLPILSEKG